VVEWAPGGVIQKEEENIGSRKRPRPSISSQKAEAGKTLIELIVTVAVSLIIIAVVFEFFLIQKKRYRTEDTLLEAQTDGAFAVEYITGIVENAGYNVRHGTGIEAASDHYLTVVFDKDDDGVIEASEVMTIAVNRDYRDISKGGRPTEIVHDPLLSKVYGKAPHEYLFDVYFDMDKDGVINHDERFVSGYDIDEGPDDSDRRQVGAVKLFLSRPAEGFGIYLYTLRLYDDKKPYEAGGILTGNPYIVNPKPDIIVENVDNFIIRYFDMEDLPLPAVVDKNGNRKTPMPPYFLTAWEMAMVRRVEFLILLKTDIEGAEKSSGADGGYAPGSVAAYDDSGRPRGWSCGDAGFPFRELCGDLDEWDCFFTVCRDKRYPEIKETVPYGDDTRRLLFMGSATPKNLNVSLPEKNPYEYIDESCYEDSFDDYACGGGAHRWDPPEGIWAVSEAFKGDRLYSEKTKRLLARKSLIAETGAELFWKTRGRNKGFDNYEVKVDIFFHNDADSSLGGTNAGLCLRMGDPAKYYAVMIRNETRETEDDGNDFRLALYDGRFNSVYGDDLGEPFTIGKRYRLVARCVDNTFECGVYSVDLFGGETRLDDFTWTDEKNALPQGPPGLRVFNAGASFDNFKICPIFVEE
jgi:hypothetical protein